MSPGAFRFCLAFVVVLHHSTPLRLGAWAVGLFFVLSGYWIAVMWRSKYQHAARPYLTFLASRWWRLAPLFIVVNLVAALLVARGSLPGNRAAAESWAWRLTQPLVLGSTQVTRVLPPAWSLDVEMQFYTVAPLLVAGLAVLGPKASFMHAVVLGVWGFGQFLLGASLETPRLDLWAWAFAVGAGAAIFAWRPLSGAAWASAAALVGLVSIAYLVPMWRSLVWQRGADPRMLAAAVHATFNLALVVASIPLAIDSVHRSSGRLDRWLGDLSYPLYLVHWLPREWYYARVDWTASFASNLALLLANLFAALLLAVLLLHLVDRPAQRWRTRWTQRQLAPVHDNAMSQSVLRR